MDLGGGGGVVPPAECAAVMNSSIFLFNNWTAVSSARFALR